MDGRKPRCLASGTALTKWFMSWAWLQTSGTTVDFFDPGAPTPSIDQRMASHLESERAEAIWVDGSKDADPGLAIARFEATTVTLPLTTVPTDPRWVYLGATSGSGSHSLGLLAMTAGSTARSLGGW